MQGTFQDQHGKTTAPAAASAKASQASMPIDSALSSPAGDTLFRSAGCHSQVDSIYDDLNDASEGGNESASSEGSLGQMTSEFEKALHDELEESRALVSD